MTSVKELGARRGILGFVARARTEPETPKFSGIEGHNGWRMPIVMYHLQREPPLLIASLAAASLRGCTPLLELPARVAQRAASNAQSARRFSLKQQQARDQSCPRDSYQ
jgi:hypothetical protein